MPRLTASPIVGRWTSPLLAALLFAAMSAPASADEPQPQDTNRSAILDAEREKKAAETSAPERGTVERALYWYVTDVIIRRRDKVVAYWISQTNPLDRFAVDRAASGTELAFDNAAVRLGVARPGGTYQARWMALDNLTGSETAKGPEITVAEGRLTIPGSAWGPRDDAGSRYAVAAIATIHPGFPSWSSPVLVTVRDRNGSFHVIGIERPAPRDAQGN